MSVVEIVLVRGVDGDRRTWLLPRVRRLLRHDVPRQQDARGNDNHPAWYHNILAHPEVEVVYRGKPKQKMHARVAGPEERARMWPILTKAHKNYAGYQEKTTREIPLVLLEPIKPEA